MIPDTQGRIAKAVLDLKDLTVSLSSFTMHRIQLMGFGGLETC